MQSWLTFRPLARLWRCARKAACALTNCARKACAWVCHWQTSAATRPSISSCCLLPAASVGLELLLARVRQCQAAHPGVMLEATGFASIDDLEEALQAGVALVAGRVDATRATREKRPLQTAMQRICLLLNRVVTDQDAALIAQDISADVPLSYRMLRYVNSPAVGLSRAVESIEQAVMVLGRNELYRWLSVLLLSSADGRKASRALQEIALARARLLETLARCSRSGCCHCST